MDFDSFVLAAATADLDDEPAAREHADAVEFRMDLAAEPLDRLAAYDGELPLIATNRVVGEGGDAPADPARLDRLATAAADPAVEAVDVELSAVESGAAEDLLPAAREAGVDVIVSAHDFEGTPPGPEIRDVLERAGERGDVAKFASTAHDPGDALDLLVATHERTAAGGRVATMAMGAAGRHTRAVAPVYGSRVGYAPVDPAEATAPGQFDLATLDELVGALR